MRSLLLSLAALLAIAGCGGGGTAVVFPLNSKMRLLQAGDSATYSLNGTFTPPGKPSNQITGSAVHRVTAKNGNLLTVAHDLQIIINGAPFNVHEEAVEQQNPDGSIVPVSDNGGTNGAIRTVTSTTLVSPGTYSAPLTISGTTTFSDGSTATGTLKVLSTGTAQSPLGTFSTFVIQSKSVSSFGTENDITENFSPGLGFFVTRTETGSGSTGVITVNYTLTATSVPLG